MMKEHLSGKTLPDLQERVAELGLQPYIARQLAGWLYGSGVDSFEAMTNLSKPNRTLLSGRFTPGFTVPVKESVSADGTKKYLYPTLGNRFIEAAYMPETRRNTLCLSTQVGCKMGCLFCMTGKQGFQANLTPGEIVNQLRSLPERDQVTHLVFMGMGEPFDNTEALMQSLEILTAEWGFAISPKKITVSTVGLIPGMRTFLERTDCNLAVSLHSPFDEERRRLMPVQHVYPVKEVIETLIRYNLSKYRKLSFEYILFDGINDSPRHVKEMARILNKLRCRVNLMHFHPVPNAPLKGSPEQVVKEFQQGLMQKGITATIRQSRGLDIEAACGLLSTKALLSQTNL